MKAVKNAGKNLASIMVVIITTANIVVLFLGKCKVCVICHIEVFSFSVAQQSFCLSGQRAKIKEKFLDTQRMFLGTFPQ